MNVFIFCIAGILSSGLLKCIDAEATFPLSLNNMVWGPVMGLIGYLFQWTMAESLRLERNSVIVAVINSTSLLIGYFLEITFLATPFDWASLVGCIIVFASVAGIIAYNKN